MAIHHISAPGWNLKAPPVFRGVVVDTGIYEIFSGENVSLLRHCLKLIAEPSLPDDDSRFIINGERFSPAMMDLILHGAVISKFHI